MRTLLGEWKWSYFICRVFRHWWMWGPVFRKGPEAGLASRGVCWFCSAERVKVFRFPSPPRPPGKTGPTLPTVGPEAGPGEVV